MSGYDFPLFQFLIFHFLGEVLLFSFSVPTQSVECSICSICPRTNKDSESYSTTAAVLGMSGVIRLNCRTMFFPVYTRKHHKYPVLDSRSSKIFILNFEAFSGRYCLIDRHPFQSVKLSSLAMFWFGRYRV